MKLTRLFLLLAGAFWILPGIHSQSTYSNITYYNIETFGSAATGEFTPFWITSNKYGIVPLEAGNGYLRGNISHFQHFKKGFYWSAGLDALIVAPRNKNVYIQQLYGEFGYKDISLTIGSKEQYYSLFDRDLSSGDMIQSANARPIPEININLRHFVSVPFTKDWLHFKGHFAIGRSFDKNYLEDFAHPNQDYINNMLWHHKSAFIRIKDVQGDFPLYGSFGLRHIAQWGGTSTNPEFGKQPSSLKDFVRIFFMKSGDSGSSASSQVNVLGAHHVSYDFQLGFTRKDWEFQAYYQHICSDKSGVLFYNRTDGLWGGQLDLHRFAWIQKVVVEYITTLDQSGPLHYIWFDHDIHPGRGGGADDYYNNNEYTNGLAYFNRSIGSPLLSSPEYNVDGTVGFQNTRIQDWHFGLEGYISPRIAYRTLLTVMKGYGTPYKPFLDKKTGTSFLVEMTYNHPALSGWHFTGSFAGDTGNILGEKSYGFGLKISKQGILRNWNK